MKKSKGLFFVFEGPDGSGKTTIINEVYNRLIKQSFSVEKTREPGGTPKVCEDIRNILLNNKLETETEALLFAASRTEHVKKFIIPELEKNKIILCDRFLDSSLAYQGYGRELGADIIEKINDFGIKKLRPDYLFYFDINYDESLKRISNSSRRNNLMDEEYKLMNKKIIDGYNKIIKKRKSNIFVIDAKKSIDEISNLVFNKILEIIKKHKYDNRQ